MLKFRLVTFDVTNTLLLFRSSVGQIYADTAKALGVVVDASKANDSFKKHFWTLCRQHPNYGAGSSISSRDWWTQVVKGTLRDVCPQQPSEDSVVRIADNLFNAYATDTHWDVNGGAETLLRRLREANVALGVISNFDERLHNILQAKLLSGYFDFVIASYLVKTEKPEPAIFSLALEKVAHLGIKPAEALHVGDNYQLDYLGAKAAGWNALLLKPGSEGKDDSVASFSDLERKLFEP